MKKVIACVDAAASALNVCDYATWAALRLAVPLELLHVLDRHPERAPVTDDSGSIGLGTQEALLQELGALDEKRSKSAQQHGRELLAGLVRRTQEAGLTAVESRQRHESLVEALVELQPERRLFVLRQHHPAEPGTKLDLDHHAEQAIRAVQRPVPVASASYQEPQSFAIAFDGSPTGRKIVESMAASPLLKGLECHVVMAGEQTEAGHNHLAWTRALLGAAGFDVRVTVVSGVPETSLPTCLKKHAVDLLVMGAYGHSRIRQFIMGSTTTTLLRTSPVPVLALRWAPSNTASLAFKDHPLTHRF